MGGGGEFLCRTCNGLLFSVGFLDCLNWLVIGEHSKGLR